MRRSDTLLVITVLGAVTACSSRAPAPPPGSDDEARSHAEATVMGHIHGVGVDPGDGTLYVASHFGVFRVEDGTPERVADRWQDTMGFAVVGPGHLLGSGHPDAREDLPPSLGLIESTDGGKTWSSVSLLGEADLHAIEPVGNRIYAYDSHTGSLLTTTDRRRWDTLTRAPLLDLAADPADPGTVYATTDRGVLVEVAPGTAPTPVPDAPTLTVVDWEPGGPLVGVAADGTIVVSEDLGRWRTAGTLDGRAQALDAAPGRWHAATESGVFESTDAGATWDLVLDAPH